MYSFKGYLLTIMVNSCDSKKSKRTNEKQIYNTIGTVLNVSRDDRLKPVLPTLQVHPQFLVGFRVTRSLVLCVCFVDRCLFFFFWPLCCLSFDLQIQQRVY
jgi:hypothetical protein